MVSMRVSDRMAYALVSLLVLCGCEDQRDPEAANTVSEAPDAPDRTDASSAPTTSDWTLERTSGQTVLRYQAPRQREVRMICRDRAGDLLINVPEFRPVGSEERMTFGSGGVVETIVADFRGDADRGGVTGTGPVPRNLKSLLSGAVSINYGNQTFTARNAPEGRVVEQFVASCSQDTDVEALPVEPVSACLVQDGQKLSVTAYRALGTEPFWNARIEGRCVTYSHPDNIAGSRIWTRYQGKAGGGGQWTGALDQRRFQLTITSKNGCSDGMSDRSYGYEAELIVGGEQRRGCAEVR